MGPPITVGGKRGLQGMLLAFSTVPAGSVLKVSEGCGLAVNGCTRRKAWPSSATQSENATRRAGPRTTITGPPRPLGLGRTATSTSTMAMSTATTMASRVTLPCRCCEGVRSSERHFQAWPVRRVSGGCVASLSVHVGVSSPGRWAESSVSAGRVRDGKCACAAGRFRHGQTHRSSC